MNCPKCGHAKEKHNNHCNQFINSGTELCKCPHSNDKLTIFELEARNAKLAEALKNLADIFPPTESFYEDTEKTIHWSDETIAIIEEARATLKEIL